MSDTNTEEKKEQVREMMRRLSTADRKQVQEIIDESDDLRKENRRLLEDRRGGDSNFFGILFILSITVFAVSVLFHFAPFVYGVLFGFPGTGTLTDEQYMTTTLLQNWLSTANFTMFASVALGVVSWVFKKK